ncbi:MAG: BolA family transcriptional regulator [Acidobacteria bacterium]|nr:BolA family transcriptional regulator [Acidobacteriota bacterium]
MRMRERIETKVRAAMAPTHLEVIDETGMHNVPPGSESHFRLVIVSGRFRGRPPVERHREVNRVLAEEIGRSIHALGLRTLTPEEWAEERREASRSPACMGGDGSLPPGESEPGSGD